MNKKKILLSIGILFLIILIVGVSYAWWSSITRQKEINVLETRCIKVEMEELTNAINLIDARPLIDKEGERTKPFRFKLTNICDVNVTYNLNLEVMERENRMASHNIAVKVDDLEKSILTENPKAEVTYKESDYRGVESYTLYSGELRAKESVTHELRAWMDESADNESQNKEFYSKVVIVANQNQIAEEYQESILNGAYPVLAGDLVPVEIDDTGKVTKANIYNKWYSYEEKKWANAVILSDKTIEYKEYEEIPEENIESYFVWIPKYSYQLWDITKYTSLTNIDKNKIQTIQIKFGIKNTNDANSGECTTPNYSDATGNCKVGDYMTPPAFITMGTNGLWVGKFETGYKGATSTTAAEVNPNVSTEALAKEAAEKIQIKPNVYSWRGIQVANAHLVSYNYQRELDSHMMKNTEWGAVAYLQHSKYGSAENVRINNNSAFITGYAAVNEPTCGYLVDNRDCNKSETTALGVDGTYTLNYKNTSSQVASTTGNYTGIYDMSGGAWEYMMTGLLDTKGNPLLSGKDITHHSNFNGDLADGSTVTNGIDLPDEKYYDFYRYSDSNVLYSRRILGDATAEFGPFANMAYYETKRQIGSWYDDEAQFVFASASWVVRGGATDHGVNAGIFAFESNPGNIFTGGSFRIVLAV